MNNLNEHYDVTTPARATAAATAIDFKQLLRQERQKAREQERHRRRQRLQQQQQHDEAKEEDKNEANNDTLPLSKKCAPPPPVWNHAHLKLQQQNDDDDNSNSPPRLDRLDTKRHVVCSSNPSAIYYIPNFISADYQKALMEWLLQLPENSIKDNKQQQQLLSVQQQEEHAMGCWTTMRYGQRRVALFDNRPSHPLTSTKNDDDGKGLVVGSRRGFPEPLASLAQHISNFMAEIIMPLSLSLVSNISNMEKEEDPEEVVANSSSSGSSSSTGMTCINHILINDYFTSHQGIMPHTDGPAYQPLTATLSLESSAILHFTPSSSQSKTSSSSTNHNAQQQQDNDDKEKETRRNVSVLLEPGSLVIFHQQAYSDYLHSIRGISINNSTTAAAAAIAENDDNKQQHDNDDDNDNDNTAEVVSETCVNAPAGMIVKRGPQRISLTFRIKK